MKDLASEISEGMHISTKDEYVEFIRKLSKPEVKRKVFLRLINTEEDEEEKDFSAKRLGSNSEVFLFFVFCFFV